MMKRRDFLAALAMSGAAGLLTSGFSYKARAGSERIVSIGGSISEIVVALGRGDSLVAVDSTSRFPERLQHLPQVGYMRTLASEGILSMAPTKILASSLAGPGMVIKQLESSGLLTVIPDKPSVMGIADKIRRLGEVLNRKAEAELMARDVTSDLTAVDSWLSGVSGGPRVAFLHNIGRSAPLVGGVGHTGKHHDQSGQGGERL